MNKGLPNIYSIGMPKTGGTSLNSWLRDNTRWNVINHDALDIVNLLYEGDESLVNFAKKSRSQKRDISEARTGMMHIHWKKIVEMDPEALFIMTVRKRVDEWAGSFWRHFSRPHSLYDCTEHRNRGREILGLFDGHLPVNASGENLLRIEKPGMTRIINQYMQNQFEMAEWVANNPNACVISLDGGTDPESLLYWMYDRISPRGDGSMLTWSKIVYSETDVGNPVVLPWPHDRRAPEYEMPLWVVVECMDFESMWQSQVMSQIL